MTITATEREALARAFSYAARGPGYGPNPQVGAVIFAADGTELGHGWHHGAGTPHAEVEALRAVADLDRIAGGTAVVTLEPCHHTGRTPPCSRALFEAGLARVVYGAPDPNPLAGGGAAWLTSQGIDAVYAGRDELVDHDAHAVDAVLESNRQWATYFGVGRPYLIAKIASTLDGRSAAADGSSQWITSAEARAHAHQVRAGVDAIMIGTGTALADDPTLTARLPSGELADHQPLRVVLGERETPASAALRQAQGAGELIMERSRDLGGLLRRLGEEREVRRVLLEGGPTLIAGALRDGFVDELHAYLAPALLGAGAASVGDLGITSIDQALRMRTTAVRQLGPDVLVIAQLEVFQIRE